MSQREKKQEKKQNLLDRLVFEFKTMTKPDAKELAVLTGRTLSIALVSALVISVFDFAFVELLRLFI